MAKSTNYSKLFARFQVRILEWSTGNLRQFPWRKKRIHAYNVFLAEMLLKRTTAKAASSVYVEVKKKFPSVRKLAIAREKDLVELVKPIGYQQRAKEMVTAARFILKNFGIAFPRQKEQLLTIPYVGDYTSSAIMSLSYNKPFAMVDSNVNRIISRVFFGRNATSNISNEVKEIASQLVPKKEQREFNLAMLDIGGTICLPRQPRCAICPLEELCKFRQASEIGVQ